MSRVTLCGKGELHPLVPASSTWFSFAIDFLYLDFGRSCHTLLYGPGTFTSSIVEPEYVCPKLFRYTRPSFDEELAKRVKNLVISAEFRAYLGGRDPTVNELVAVFTGVEVLVLADQLHNTCELGCEYEEVGIDSKTIFLSCFIG